MTKKQKHLTLEDRIDIQTGISQQETFRSIAEKIGKDPSTISKEIKRNRIMHPTSVKSDKQGKFLSDGQGLNPRHSEETKHLPYHSDT